jgi:DNA-binding MarR family transcriptional regulator
MTTKANSKKATNLEDLGFDLMTFLPHRLAILSRLSQVLLGSALEASGLTIAQWRVYLSLIQNGPSTLNAIAEFTQLPQSSLSRSVARMAERNLVRNARNEADRRLSHIEITDEGREKLANAIHSIREQWTTLLSQAPLNETEFLATVNSLIDYLSLMPDSNP